jgi:FkbM family methyltransferase
MDNSIEIYRYNFALRCLRKFLLKTKLAPATPVINFFGFKFVLDLKQEGISKVIYVNRVREVDHSTVFKNLISNKRKCLDLGANIGYYMLLTLANSSSHSEILCIEPDARNIKVLEKNIKINDLESRVSVIHAAVADHIGKIKFEITSASNLNKIQLEEKNPVLEGKKFDYFTSVKSMTLDQIYQERGVFESVRMDIEGAEALIFQEHSFEFLSAMPKNAVIFMEVHPGGYIPNSDAMASALENIRSSGFSKFGLISSGQGPDPILLSLLGSSKEIYKEGRFSRHHYDNVAFEDWKKLALIHPKMVRYIYCTKN